MCGAVQSWLVLCVALCVALRVAGGLRPQCPLQAPEPEPRCQEREGGSTNPYYFKLDGRDVIIHYVVGTRFEMQCDSGSRSAEHPALPRFNVSVIVSSVTLWRCVVPVQPYASLLAALNVTVTDELLLRDLITDRPLHADLFKGLSSLVKLQISATYRKRGSVLPHTVLSPLQALRDLTLRQVQPGKTLQSLPASLSSLSLWSTGVQLFAPVDMMELQHLSIRDEGSVRVNLTGASNLTELVVSSRNSTIVGLLNHGSLRKLGVDYWSEKQPKPWQDCTALEEVSLIDNVEMQEMKLPDYWVARCTRLRVLELRRVQLAALPAALLANAIALQELKLQGCGLTALPSDLFNASMQLKFLDLSHNRLSTIPRELFRPLQTLTILDLTDNLLTASEAQALQPLTALRSLRLGDNPRLSDLCDAGTDAVEAIADDSPLHVMADLAELVLRNTSVSRVCRDWRTRMLHLRRLDLFQSNIKELKFEDIVQQRSVDGASMMIGGTDYTVRFHFSKEDFERMKNLYPTSGDVTVFIEGTVSCDCQAYWAALAFRVDPRRGRLQQPSCTNTTTSLKNVLLDQLMCSVPELCTNMPNCSCFQRDDSELTVKLAIANCESRGHEHIPGPPPPGYAWRMLLAHNRITSVNKSELPVQIRELDLRYNAIGSLSEEAARALLSRSALLSGNEFSCNCSAIGLVRAVLAHPEYVYSKQLTCDNGEPLPSLSNLTAKCTATPHAAPVSTPSLLVVGSAVLMVVAVAALTLLTLARNRELQLRIKIRLEGAGWLQCCGYVAGDAGRDHEGGHLYDVFVSYAHEDEDWVRDTLVARLEGGEGPYRLCVHYRDWAPGEWIPAQIAASVRTSRRTLAVVSRHFLKSHWARLEFREAHAQARLDVTPRLVVLLLEEPELLPLDAEMRAFVENNTYVRWGDPWFWRKLEHAMPLRPRVTARSSLSEGAVQ